jgi:hypothetical protein
MVNEILWTEIGELSVQSFYLEAYTALRRSTCVDLSFHGSWYECFG